MRQIGSVPSEEWLQRLADYLFTLGIRIQAEPASEGGFAVWAIDEDRVVQARDELSRFIENPDDERYRAAEREARRLRDDLIAREKARQKNIVDVRSQWRGPRTKPVTFGLIAASCVVALATGFGEESQNQITQKLLFASYNADGIYHLAFRAGSEILHGEIWRLITPIFLHFGPMHLVMNMLATHSLGTVLEIRLGSWRLAAMVLAIGLISNVSQYLYSGPSFGGMSGVAFGLFGYAWMKSEFDPEAGLFIPPRSVVMMLGWLVLCMTGLIGPIANAAHFSGLIVGILLGYGPVVRRRILGR
jgi:GlpG protein